MKLFKFALLALTLDVAASAAPPAPALKTAPSLFVSQAPSAVTITFVRWPFT